MLIQKPSIKCLTAYARPDGETRYVTVLTDNTIWWYAPGYPWQPSPTEGLPTGFNIEHFAAYVKADGTRYVVVLTDNTIWWYAPGYTWIQGSIEGLPTGFDIQTFRAYNKDGETRYVVTLHDNTIWWHAPGHPWVRSQMDGLPDLNDNRKAPSTLPEP